jgi:medium-chain acyl-[acyl-carrier-protein] hydrolase
MNVSHWVETDAAAPWIRIPQPNPRASVRLYCVPYAGAGSTIFHGWRRGLPPWMELCLIELPGRGRRQQERRCVRVPELADPIARALQQHIDRRFALFGHSMGALITFEVARRLHRRGCVPQVLFASAHRAPQLPRLRPPTFALSDAGLIGELRRMNSAPPEVIQQPELLPTLLGTLRADLELCQTYVYEEGPPLRCPIVAFGGLNDDEVHRTELEAWRGQTSASFSLEMVEGNHFFLIGAEGFMLSTITTHLTAGLSAQTASRARS